MSVNIFKKEYDDKIVFSINVVQPYTKSKRPQIWIFTGLKKFKNSEPIVLLFLMHSKEIQSHIPALQTDEQ